jgi:hypothetical protein
VEDSSDFAFIVLGDPGEGDASLEVLHDRIIAVSREPGVRFLVVSSDVTYPVGAMRARIQADMKFTVTTDKYVEELIREADRLRGEYRVSTGYQDAPFDYNVAPFF